MCPRWIFPKFSVTIVAFVRLVYLIKADAEPANVAINLCNILIWTGVEVNMSLVCGQYTKNHVLFNDQFWTDGRSTP